MYSPKKIQWAFFFLMPFLFVSFGKVTAATDDYAPEVTARVARISYISGDVQIRRADSRDWEHAAINLPVVEGDEIATDNALLEIQFNSETYLRLSGNAYFKVTTLRDEGIAVSLPNGSMSVRILNFDKDRAYFEIDAPQTTVSVERAGVYGVDAGSQNDSEVRVSVTDSGQARVYSENSGFTLKNGRSAAVKLKGDYAGEWETSDAFKYADEFDGWALQRDAVIARRLRDSYYDKYYDRDIYGAEELNEYGEWILTKKYGYVWKPYRSSVSSYADWSPYRYGQWRWVPPYGWTWVNDEPWGWATYHHGRWVYDNGSWCWSPYGSQRARRSWWRPALVVITYAGGNICWYPLPYNYGYYNYNSYYYDRRRYNTTIVKNTTVIVNPTPTPAPTPTVANPIDKGIPSVGVITVSAGEFGRGKSNFRTASPDLATRILSQTISDADRTPVLPGLKELNGRISKEILVEKPLGIRNTGQSRIGAITRTSGVSTGETLQKERIWGNRTPILKTAPEENDGGLETGSTIRNTGAVRRQSPEDSAPNNENPKRRTWGNGGLQNTNPIRSTGGNSDDENQPIRKTRRGSDREISPPVFSSPREERINRPQQPRKERREEEPVRQPRESPRVQSPARIETRRDEIKIESKPNAPDNQIRDRQIEKDN